MKNIVSVLVLCHIWYHTSSLEYRENESKTSQNNNLQMLDAGNRETSPELCGRSQQASYQSTPAAVSVSTSLSFVCADGWVLSWMPPLPAP